MKNYKQLLLLVIGVFFSINSIAADSVFSKRFERIKLQAAAGEKRPQYKLALSYLRGLNVRTDITEAIYWFKKSAKQGYVKSAHKLGMIYYFNKDGKKRYAKAFYWFKKAATQSHAESQYYLGKLYLEGKGVRRSYVRALYWLKLAKASDFLAAAREISILKSQVRSSGKPVIAARRIEKRPISPPVKTAAVPEPKVTNPGVGGPFRPAPKIATAIKPAPAPRAFKTREMLMAGFWLINGKPAENMPSALTKCDLSHDIMTCLTERLNKHTSLAQIAYKVQARILNFKSNGSFDIQYRKNFIFVLPFDADDPNPDPNIPVMGWQKKINKLKCRIVSNKNIRCKSPKGSKHTLVEKYYK